MPKVLDMSELENISGGTMIPRYLRYKVKKNDTLYELAIRFKTDVNELARINYIADPNKIREGSEIIYPNPDRKQ